MKCGKLKGGKSFHGKTKLSRETNIGVWEGLLLGCAIHHYDTESWDSISAELRKRSTTTSSHLITVNKSITHSTFWLGLLQAHRISTPIPQIASSTMTRDSKNQPWTSNLRRNHHRTKDLD